MKGSIRARKYIMIDYKLHIGSESYDYYYNDENRKTTTYSLVVERVVSGATRVGRVELPYRTLLSPKFTSDIGNLIDLKILKNIELLLVSSQLSHN